MQLKTILPLLSLIILLQTGASAIQVTLNTPAQDNVRMYGQYNFSATVVGTAGETITSVQVQNGTGGNWIAMSLSSGTAQNGNWSVVLDLTGMPDGARVFTYNATNGTVYNDTTTVTAVIDNTLPSTITISDPANDSWTSSSTVLYNFTAVDILAANLTCNVTENGAVIYSNTSVLNNTPTVFTLSKSENSYTFNITCWDNAVSNILSGSGNQNVSETRTFRVDSTAPAVSQLSPVDGYNTTSTANTITINVTDNLSPNATCYVYVDGAQGNGATVSLPQTSLGLSQTFAEGAHQYYVNCTDAAGNSNTTPVRTLTVDQTPPIVNLMTGSPANATNTTSTTLSAQFNFTDALSSVASCTLYVDGSAAAQNTSTANNTLTTLSAAGLSQGTHSWYVNCSDHVSLWNVSETRTYNVDLTNPQLSAFVYPTVSGWVITGSEYVYGNFSDYFTGVANVKFALFNSSNENVTPWTSMSLYSGTITQGEWRGLLASASVADGMYSIKFNITDYSSNYNDTTGVQPVYVDNNPPVIAWAYPANNSAFNQYTSRVTVVVNATDAATNITNTIVSVSGGTADFNQATNCTNAPNFRVCQFVWDLTGVPDGEYQINVTMSDDAFHDALSSINVTVDNTPPSVSFGTVSNAVQVNGRWYTTAGETVTVPVTVSDATSGVNTTAVTVMSMDNQTLKTCTGTTPVNCQLTPNESGMYTFVVFSNDSAGNVNQTEMLAVWVVNGVPGQEYDSSKMALQSASISTIRSAYSVPVPMYNIGDESILNGFWVNPVYTDKPLFAGATSMEDLAYNYTFQLNASSLSAQHELVTINLTTPGLIPARVVTETIYTPGGPLNMTRIFPEMIPGQFGFSNVFTIEYNGTKYSNNGSLSSQPVSGTFSFNPGNGMTSVSLTVNATNGTVVPVTLYLSSVPPINVTQQTITGFDPTTAPPELGATLNTSYMINVSAINEFYTQDTVYLDFVFPKNVTVTLPNSTTTTINVSTGVTLKEWNGTGWGAPNATRTSAYSACFNVTDNITGSPTNGANITVCFSGYRYQITVAVSDHTNLPNAWLVGRTLALRANTTLSFPAISEVVPSGTAGYNDYRATVNMAQQGNIKLTNSDVPGITNADQITVYVDGAPWQGSYQLGSLTLLDGTLPPGVHNIKVNYHIPSSGGTGTTTGGTYSGGSVPLGGSATAETGEEQVPGYADEQAVIQKVTSDEELKNALETALGEELAGDLLDMLAEQSYQHAADFRYSASMTSTTQSSVMHVTVRYAGDQPLYNVVVYDTIPKDFAADISDVTINAPGATVHVVRADPVIMLVYDQVNPGDELSIDYQASGWKDINIVSEKQAADILVAGKPEAQPEQPPAQQPEQEVPENVTKPEAQPEQPPAQPPAKPEEVTPAAQDYTWTLAAVAVAIVAVLIAAVLWARQQKKPAISKRRR